MNKTFYSLLICLTIIFLFENILSAQSVEKKMFTDSLEKKREIAPLYPNIDHFFNKYSINGRYLRTKEIMDRLSISDSTAFYQYKKGRDGQHIGVGLIAGGAGLFLIGEVVVLAKVLGNIGTSRDNGSPAGATFMILGGGCLLTGIVKTITGGQEKRKAITTYNQAMYLKRKRVGLYIHPGLTGISVVLRF